MTAGVNLVLMNGLPIDVSTGMELYPLLERISAEVNFPAFHAPRAFLMYIPDLDSWFRLLIPRHKQFNGRANMRRQFHIKYCDK